ncbi:MAG TPA: GldG family protein [Elusimicrobiota bacterium]|nr:GldG family protein [Elusimicrobiota bacterium]
MNRTRKLAFSWTGTALVLAILAAVNVAAHFVYGRLDFSAGRIYTLSSGTKNILDQLKDDMVVKVYYSPHLPAPYGPNGFYIHDLLEEYRSASHGRMKLEFIDPDSSEKAKQEAEDAGVEPVQINVLSKDQFSVKQIFMGAVFLYQGKAAVIPVFQDMSNLEYDLSQRINKLTQAKTKTLGFVTGHGEKSPTDPAVAPIFQSVSDEATLRTVSLDKPIDPKFDALWILGPRDAYKPAEIERLKAWVNSGRPLGIMIDRSNVNIQSFQASPISTGLSALLATWGANVSQNFVADQQAEKIQLQARMGMFILPVIRDYPFIPVVNHIDDKSPITRGIEVLTFPFVHAVVFKSPEGSGLAYESLADSTPNSWLEPGYFINPDLNAAQLPKGHAGPFSLAGLITGDFSKAAPSSAQAVAGEPNRAAPGQVLVVGTSYQLDSQLSDKASNQAFILNLLDWSMQNKNLLSIRAKAVSYRPLRAFPTAERELLKYFLVFFPTLLLIVIAFFVYRRQKLVRRFLPLAYGEPQNA